MPGARKRIKTMAKVRFQGKVQGVFFRANTRKFATRNGLTGEVKNCTDGSVKAVFEGERYLIEKTIEQCIHRQPYANVTEHEIVWCEYSIKYESFEIKYRGGC